MSAENNITSNTKSNTANATTNVTDRITMDAVQQRWAQIFGKYGKSGFDTVSQAWNLAWSQANNPFLQNARIKQSVAKPLKAQQEDMQQALTDPESGELTLTRISMWLYYTNYIYNLLIKLNRDTPLYNYYFLPQYCDEKDYKTEAFKKESQKVDKIMKSFKPQLTLKTITTQVSLEGKSSYLPRISYEKDKINFFVMQKLNTNMVKLTGFASKQQFKASFNMMIFLQPAYDVNQYPQFIRDTWQEMNDVGLVTNSKKGAIVNPKAIAQSKLDGILEYNSKSNYYMYWVELPQDLCYTFYSDGAHPNMFPDTIGLFNDLNELDDYRWLQANLLSKGVNSVLTAQVPVIKDAKAGSDATVITPDTILGYQDYFAGNVSSNILAFFAPFNDFKLHTIDSQPEALDVVYDRTRDLIATSGNSALMAITDKPSIASVKAAQAIQAARVDYLTKQYENFLNEVVNNCFDLKYTWKISLWGDIFNHREDLKQLKELVLSGLEGFIPKLLSAMGYTMEDYKTSCDLLKAWNIKVEKVLTQENLEEQAKQGRMEARQKAKEDKEETEGLKNGVGRDAIPDDEVENDATAAARDSGTNVSDIKEFAQEFLYGLSEEDANEVINELVRELEDDA